MANVKITELTALTDPASSDVLPIVDVGADTTKKVTIADLLENAGDGAAATPAFSFDNDKNTGIYRPGADQLALVTGGTARLTVSTSAVTSALPVDVLLGSASTPSFTFTGDLNTGIYSPGADQVAISTNGAGRLFIDSSGNTGIGTSSPVTLLDISSSDNTYVTVQSTANDKNALTYYKTGQVASSGFYVGLNASEEAMVWQTENNVIRFGTNNTDAMRIDSSGRLLVGTSSSTSTDTMVLQGSTAGSTANAIFRMRRGSNPTSGQAVGSILFENSSQDIGASIVSNADANWTSGSSHPTRLVFSTTAATNSSPTEALRISSGQDLLLSQSGSGFFVGTTTDGAYRIGRSSYAVSSGTLYIGNAAIQVSSDARLKENIEDTNLDALDAIGQISVKDFTWNDPTDTSANNRNARGKWTGLIAQELVEVLPFVVNAPRNENGEIDHDSENIWTLDQSQLCPVLIKAMQQQQAMIAELQAKVAALEAQ